MQKERSDYHCVYSYEINTQTSVIHQTMHDDKAFANVILF